MGRLADRDLRHTQVQGHAARRAGLRETAGETGGLSRESDLRGTRTQPDDTQERGVVRR